MSGSLLVDLGGYLMYVGLLYIVVMLGWVMVSLKEWCDEVNKNNK
jgi:hypothetical protein